MGRRTSQNKGIPFVSFGVSQFIESAARPTLWAPLASVPRVAKLAGHQSLLRFDVRGSDQNIFTSSLAQSIMGRHPK